MLPQDFPYKKYLQKLIFAASLIGCLGFFVLWQSSAKDNKSLRILEKEYPLIGKRALLSDYRNDLLINFLPLRGKLHETIDPYADTFAIYFEYLPTGTSIGINEDTEFTAASLLKVPVVMAYYHKKESSGFLTDQMVKIQPDQLDSHFGDLYKKGAGYEISLDDAARLALTESDNTASLVLAGNISDDDFSFVYEGLDVKPALKGDSPVITAQQYASILKALYFSSILTRDNSEKILELLTHQI